MLDITKALKAWQFDYHTNQGLMVEIIRKDADIQLHPVAVGLATNREEHPDKEVSCETTRYRVTRLSITST